MKTLKTVFKKLTGYALAIIVVLSNIPAVVFAAGGSTANITGGSSVAVGGKITLTINSGTLDTSDGKIYSMGGVLSFDDTILKLNKCTNSSNIEDFSGKVNATSKKIAIYDGEYETGVGGNLALFSCEFEGLAAGKTTVTIQTSKGANTMEINDKATNKLYATVTGKEVTVGGATSSSTSTSKATSSSTTTSTSAAASSSSTSTPAPTPSPNAKPASISVSGYTMSPSFNADTQSYTVTVPSTATFVTIVVTKGHAGQTISGDGNFTLTGDSSTATVTVTAEDGTPKVYTITINKQAPEVPKDGDNSLKDLTVGGTTITGFDKDKTSYSMEVGEDVTSINVAGIANSSKASVTVSGASNLKAGVNPVTVTVTAENGSKRVYTINVTKPSKPGTTAPTGTTKKGDKSTTTKTTKKPSNETGVTSINIGSPHTIDPEFSNDKDVYNVTVPYDVDKLDLSLYLKDSKATYTVTGNENFQVGKVNVVTVTVKAEDGTTRTIIFNVTRTTDEDDTGLTDIGLGGGVKLSPEFDPDILGYTVNVDGGTDKLDLNPKAPEGTTVKTYGNENFKEGWNTVLISATDKKGYTRTYTLSVYKEPKKILGLTYRQFAIVAGIIGGLLLTFFLILLLLARRRKRENQPVEQAPIIDFKPEFNFGSRNGTDDDTVYPNGILNQDSTVQKDVEVENSDAKVMKALNPTVEPEPIAIPTHEAPKEIPYDPYDEVVTKDELIDAIEEGLETKNPEKLKMLLEQEELNRKKEELRRRDHSNR